MLRGYKVRAIVSREAIKDDEISLQLHEVFTKLEVKWSRVGVKGKRMILSESSQQGCGKTLKYSK